LISEDEGDERVAQNSCQGVRKVIRQRQLNRFGDVKVYK